MKKVGKILLRDFCRIRKNTIAVIVVAGMMIVPSLYAWFNIAASWDPYKNTSSLKVAVANTDAGYQGDIFSMNVNLGELVQNSLRENQQLNWTFVDEKDAIDGVKAGEYYAAIVIPEDFSREMLSLFSADVRHSELRYYLNEKENAIAPKITDKGADEIQKQVDVIFARTAAQAGLDVLNMIASEAEQTDAEEAVSHLSGNLMKISDSLRAAASTVDAFEKLTVSMEKTLESSSAFLENSGKRTKTYAKCLKDAGSTVESLQGVFSEASETVEKVLDQGGACYDEISVQVDALAADITAGTQAAQGSLDALAGEVQVMIDRYTEVRNALAGISESLPETQILLEPILTSLDESIAGQEALRDKLSEAGKNTVETAAALADYQAGLKGLAVQNRDKFSQIREEYNSQVKGNAEELIGLLKATGSQTGEILERVGDGTGGIAGTTGQAVSESEKMKSALEQTGIILRQAAERTDNIRKKMLESLQNGNIETIEDILGSGTDTASAFLAAPVKLEKKSLYPVKNYGSAMAPFYTVLSIWVGGIILAAMLKTSIPETWKTELGGLKEWQMYLGRYGLFFCLGLAQSTLICLGDLYFLEIQCEHPFLFLLSGWFTSIVFVHVIYTLTVSLGDIGKAVCVILLVIQVAGTGGTFPVEVAPLFFRKLYPLLPFTHAMTAMRETIAGLYKNTYWTALGKLGIFLLVSLTVGLVLRKPLIKTNRRFMEKLEETKLM